MVGIVSFHMIVSDLWPRFYGCSIFWYEICQKWCKTEP